MIPSGPTVTAIGSTSSNTAASPGTQRKTRVTLADGSRVIDDYGADGTTLADQRVYDVSGALVLFKLFDASGRTLRATATNADGSTTTGVYASGVLTKTFTQNADSSRTVDDYDAAGLYVLDRRSYGATGTLTGFTSLGPNGHNPAVTETAGTPSPGADLVGTGTLVFAAPASAGAHTASVSFDAAASGTTTPLGTLVPVVAKDAAGGAAGEVDWTYVVPASQVESLSAGQSLAEVFDVTLTDQHGGTLVKPVAVVLAGTNDAPVPAITSGDSAVGAVSDTPDAPKNALGYYTATGTLSFTDPDLQDVHSISSIDPDYLAPGLTSWSAQLIQDSTGGGTGRFRWTYAISLQDLQALAPGETATKKFQIEVTDDHGGAVDETVSITLTGTADHAINHAPVLTFRAQSGPLVEAGLGTAGKSSATIAVTASDRDPGDRATILATGWAPVDATHVTKEGTYGSAVLDLVTGVITYTLDNARVQTDALAAGQKASDSFAVTDQDTHGLTTTKDATFAVTGTNDAPVFVSGTTDQSFGPVVSIVDGYWAGPVFSPDSAELAYTTIDPEVGPNDTGVFVTDLATGAVTRVSMAADGTPEEASAPAFSRDGTEVAFLTTAQDLLPAGAAQGVVLKNLATGAVTPALSTTAAPSTSDSINSFALSPDGTKIAFDSGAVGLVRGDTNGSADVFIKDIATGAITRVSTTDTGAQLDGAGSNLVWSPDGTELLFSTSGQAPEGSFSAPHVVLKNLTTGTLTDLGTGLNDAVFSPDGTKVAYTALDYNVNGLLGTQVVVHDLVTGTDMSVVPTSEGDSQSASFLPDGNSIVFSASAALVPNDTNNTTVGDSQFGTDIFIENLQTGAITRVSTAAGDVQANGSFYLPLVSPDGTKLAFGGGYTDIVPGTTQIFDLYLKDIADRLTAMPALAVTDDGSHAMVTATGRLLFTDPDRADSHTVTVSAPAGDLGTLAATQARDSTGQLTGVIDLSYQVTHAGAAAALASGQTRMDAFVVTVDDGHGGTAKQTVSVALTEAGPASAAQAIAGPSNGIAMTDASDVLDGAGARSVDVQQSGQTLVSDFFDTFQNHGDPSNTFVFDPGHGLDVVRQFRADGADHDTLSFLGSDFGNSIAEVLQNSADRHGGVVITDPTSGDTVRLAGVSKAELKANQGDFVFHT